MKLIIKTKDIEIEYQDEYSHIIEDAKKRIIDIIHSLPINSHQQPIERMTFPNQPFVGTVSDFFNSSK